jgi:hypothetical protein
MPSPVDNRPALLFRLTAALVLLDREKEEGDVLVLDWRSLS